MQSIRISMAGAVWAVVATILLTAVPHSCAQERVIYSFAANGVDGVYPQAALVADASGNLYGTTSGGGAGNCGIVFELSLVSGVWVETILHTFTGGTDGCNPGAGSLIFDSAGNLYGMTLYGGTYNGGTAFKLQRVGAAWKEITLRSFGDGVDGYGPFYNLTWVGGSLFGTNWYTATGLPHGTAFELTPAGSWTSEILLADPCDCSGGLVFHNGVFYAVGAVTNAIAVLTPIGGGKWISTYTFIFPTSGLGGVAPTSYPIFDAAGNIYGTAEGGGTFDGGVVYELSLVGGQWIETVLHSFAWAPGDGEKPWGRLIFDGYGNLYGTTQYGGHFNAGLVFEMSSANGQWTENVLFTFGAPGNLAQPSGGLIMVGGNLYGTATMGGSSNQGGVFEIIR